MLIIGQWFVLGDYIGDGYWKCEDRFTESARSNLLQSLLGVDVHLCLVLIIGGLYFLTILVLIAVTNGDDTGYDDRFTESVITSDG